MNRGRRALAALLVACALGSGAAPAGANNTPATLPFFQNWSNVGLITVDNDWGGVPAIEGFDGSDPLSSVSADPNYAFGPDGALDVSADRANPNSPGPPAAGLAGVAEFEIADPAVALRGDPTHDRPELILYLDTRGRTTITFSCRLRDVDGGPNNQTETVVFQYRVGAAGTWTNFLTESDVTLGPNDATLETPVSATLPAAVDNAPLIEIRIMTGNGIGNDEWVGVDDISVTGTIATGVEPPAQRAAFRLAGRPNPSAATTTFEFAVPAPGRTTLEVFDPRGRRVRSLADEVFTPGDRVVAWDGRDEGGSPVPGGVYFVRLRSGGESRTMRFVRLR